MLHLLQNHRFMNLYLLGRCLCTVSHLG